MCTNRIFQYTLCLDERTDDEHEGDVDAQHMSKLWEYIVGEVKKEGEIGDMLGKF